MTPHRRLDQLEPVVADVLQKVDRLIEGHGQIITEVSKIPGIETNTNNTAEAVAKLTVSTQRQYEELKSQTQSQYEELKNQTQFQYKELKDQTQHQFGELKGQAQSQYEELKGKYEELRFGQDAIMQYLREKLS